MTATRLMFLALLVLLVATLASASSAQDTVHTARKLLATMVPAPAPSRGFNTLVSCLTVLLLLDLRTHSWTHTGVLAGSYHSHGRNCCSLKHLIELHVQATRYDAALLVSGRHTPRKSAHTPCPQVYTSSRVGQVHCPGRQRPID